MMSFRPYLLLSVALVLLTGVSCTREEVPGLPGRITLTLNTAEEETKAGDGVVEDGGGIARNGEDPDLMIALVSRSGRVIARYPGDGDLLSVESTNSTVEFQDINAGTYTVYAVANAQGLEAATRSAFASATTSSEIEDVLVLPSDGSASFLGGRMPLSAKGSVTVNAGGNGQVNLDLLRVFARVSLSFFNETGEELTVSDCTVSIEKMSPFNGYLFGGRSADYVSTPTPAALVLSHASAVTMADQSSTSFQNLSQLVFPSRAPAHPPGYRYLCAISFTAGGKQYSFQDLPVHDRRSADIQTVGRNQHLKIETRIGKKTEDENVVSFYFEVGDWQHDKEAFVWFH